MQVIVVIGGEKHFRENRSPQHTAAAAARGADEERRRDHRRRGHRLEHDPVQKQAPERRHH